MRKLLFFGRLCNCLSSNRAKHLFFYRLTSSDFGRSKHIGFINDIIRICEKYGLMRFINTLKHIGTFPTAFAWNTIVKLSVNEYNNNAWLAETATDDFSRLRSVQQSMNKPAVLWTTALRYPAILHKFAFLARLLRVFSDRTRQRQNDGANVKTKASLLYKFFDVTRPV